MGCHVGWGEGGGFCCSAPQYGRGRGGRGGTHTGTRTETHTRMLHLPFSDLPLKSAPAYRGKGGQNTDTAFLALRLRVVLYLLLIQGMFGGQFLANIRGWWGCPRGLDDQRPLNGGVSNGGVSRSGLVLPFLSFFVLFCPFLSFFVLFCPFGIFPIFPGTLRGFSRFVLFLFLGLLTAPTRNSPERVRDTIWTFPEKSGKHPGLEPPRFSFSQDQKTELAQTSLLLCRSYFLSPAIP